jgi:hypothetical protein
MGVVIEICVKHPGGRTRKKGTAMLSYLCIISVLPVTVPACIAVMSVTYTSIGAQALTLVLYLVSCPSRSSRYLCVVMFWSYLTITSNAPSGQSHLCHPFIYGSPASPLLSRINTPIANI